MTSDDGQNTFQNTMNVSRETIERLKIYESLLLKWNPAINLVGQSTISQVWIRHFLDSAQLWNLRPKNTKTWLDLGSGGGFPGLIVAILAVEYDPSLSVTLVESDARKASFLLKVSQETGITPKIAIERAEKLPPAAADVISARALAPVSKIFEYVTRLSNDNTICLLSKGENHESELTAARKNWKFELQKIPSITDVNGVILKIERIVRV